MTYGADNVWFVLQCINRNIKLSKTYIFMRGEMESIEVLDRETLKSNGFKF